MERVEITGSNIPKAKSKISQAIRVGDLIFLSGQIGKDPATGEVPQGIKAQTRQALKNIETILKAAGSSLEKVISATVFITDMNNWSDFNEVWGEYFNLASPYPARSTVGVKELLGGMLIEIQVVATL